MTGGHRFSVVPAAYVYLLRGDEVLLQLRQNTGFMDGRWAAAAAGHIELGETSAVAARREAHEELGITLESSELSPLTAMQRTDGSAAPVEQRIDWFFTATSWAGEPRILEPLKCAGLSWFSLHDLPSEIPPHERLVLEGLAEGRVEPFTTHGFARR